MTRLFWLLALVVACASCGRQNAPPPSPEAKPVTARAGSWPTMAVSLRVLQDRLAACVLDRTCAPELLQLGGLTRIRGFVADPTAGDWILVGDREPAHPPLLTEDFVVALRNAWLKYAVRQGHTLLVANPGCTIDPSPEVVAALGRVTAEIQARLSRPVAGDRFAAWHSTCSLPQRVGVMGVPFDSHFARVMVEADYFLKRLTDGSVSAEVDSFPSLLDRTLARLKEDAASGGHTTFSSWFNRFEFVPGGTTFTEDDGIVLIETCLVSLTTEAEYFNRHGKIAGTGKADPLALEFARGFSSRYQEIAAKKPIYRELEGLFRAVAIAKTLRLKTDGTGLEYLLDSFPVGTTDVPRVVAGVSNIREFHHRSERPDGYTTVGLWLPSCGGVGINIKVSAADLEKAPLQPLRTSVLSARPAAQALSWSLNSSTLPFVDRAPTRPLLHLSTFPSTGLRTGTRSGITSFKACFPSCANGSNRSGCT